MINHNVIFNTNKYHIQKMIILSLIFSSTCNTFKKLEYCLLKGDKNGCIYNLSIMEIILKEEEE